MTYFWWRALREAITWTFGLSNEALPHARQLSPAKNGGLAVVGRVSEAEIAQRLRRKRRLTERLGKREQLLLVVQFLAGAVLAWGLAEFWLGESVPLVVAGAVTLIANWVAWRMRGQVRGVWLTAFAFCGLLSKIDTGLSERALGGFRLLVIVGGPLAALAYGFLIEQPQHLRNLIAGRPR